MECPICSEEYSCDISLKRRPQVLPCGHEACESCLQRLHSSNKQGIKCPICKAQHGINPRSLPIVHCVDSTTTHKHTAGACSEVRSSEVDEKVLLLREMPVGIVSLDKKPWDVAVVEDTSEFSLQSGVVVRGSSGSDLPSPALLVMLFRIDDHLLVCDENGQAKGQIKLKYEHPDILRMTVTENGNDLIITECKKKCVVKLSLSGDVIKTSQHGVFSCPSGLCCLSDDRVAVCDKELKSVQILSLMDLSLITSVQHPLLTNPRAVTATSSHLIVSNLESNRKLIFFSLRNFTFVGRGDEELNDPAKLVHYKGNIFTCIYNDHKIIQMSESGTPISTVGSGGDGYTEFNRPESLAIICSRNGDETLVVADSGNKRLKFYKL